MFQNTRFFKSGQAKLLQCRHSDIFTKFMSKTLFLFVFLFTFVGITSAQQEFEDDDSTDVYIDHPLDPRLVAILNDTCRTPFVHHISVATYSAGYAKAWVEVRDLEPGQSFRYRKAGQSTVYYFSPTAVEGTALIANLNTQSVYEVLVTNNCGEDVVIGYIDTQTGSKDMIDVSTRLYDAIVRYQTTPGQSMPFSQYLSIRTDIPFYERLTFFQQYYLDGAPLPVDNETELPLSLRPPLPMDGCQCKMIFNTVQAVNPGTLNADGTITPQIRDSDGKVKVGNKAYYWWVRQSKGAAKWHCVWMEATKAGPTDRSWRMTMPDSLHISPMRGQLRYNLLCNDYAELPADCGCRKPVSLYYEYDTELEVHAERHTEGWFEKNAVAAGQDIAVVALHYEGSNDMKVLRTNGLSVSAECNLDMNSEFWVNSVDVARDIALLFIPDSNSLDYTALLNNLANSLQTLIQTPFYSDQACPAGELRQATLAMGDTLIYLEPNKPVNLYAFSFTNLMAGGKRSFFSWSRVNSDFHLTGYVPGGLLGGEQDHCCTRKIANWVLASDTAPLSTDDLKKEVGIILGAFSPWPVPPDPLSGIIPITTEYGWMAVSVNPLCDGHGLQDPPDDRNATAVGEKVQISLFDLSGRLLQQWKDVQHPGDVRQFILEQGVASPATGIYILQMSGECGSAVHKVILK